MSFTGEWPRGFSNWKISIRRFEVATLLGPDSISSVNRSILRKVLWLGLVLAAVFAAWSWFRPYEWRADPVAKCKVVETMVSRDLTYYWVDVHVKMNPGSHHDMQKLVTLETSNQVKHKPADTTFGSSTGGVPDEIWFKFWLESAELSHPLVLHINGGTMKIKSTNSLPNLADGGYRNFTFHRW